jgi:hypothetical protein
MKFFFIFFCYVQNPKTLRGKWKYICLLKPLFKASTVKGLSHLKVLIHVRVWLVSLPRGAWLGSQAWIYFTTHAWMDSGSWHSTHGRVWLIGTRAQPDSWARFVRVWAPLNMMKSTYSLYIQFTETDAWGCLVVLQQGKIRLCMKKLHLVHP